MKQFFKLIFLALAIFSVSLANAKNNDAVLLTVSGEIINKNSPSKKSAVFTFSDLQKLGDTTIKTTTMFSGKSEFTGPLIRDILKAVGVQPGAKEVIFIGLDGYKSRVPFADFDKWEIIAAHSINGKRMTLETKGPLWSMYPLDTYPADLANNATTGKLVWNLIEIEVR